MVYLLVNMRFLLLLLLPLLCSSQEEHISLNTVFFKEKYLREAIPVINNEDELTVFFQFRKNFTVYNFNKKGETIGASYDIDLPKKNISHLASLVNGNDINLIYSNLNGTKFSALSYNRISEKSSIKEELEIDLKKVSVIGYINNQNAFYLLTSIKKTSQLKIFTIDINLKVFTHIVDLSDFTIKGDKNWTYKLHNILFNLKVYEAPQTIKNGIPNSLETTTAINKLFLSEDGQQLFITNDYFKSKTILAKINTKTYKGELKFFEHTDFSTNKSAIKTNSFLIDDNLCSVYWLRDYVNLKIRNINTSKVINEFEIKKDHPILFKNTPIEQKGGTFNNSRILDKTNQFLRKTIHNKPGLSVFKSNSIYNLTLGYSHIEDLRPFYYFQFGLIGGMILESFGNYTKTHSVQFTSLFDNQFNHIKGRVNSNVFDKIAVFKTSLKDVNNGFLEKKNETFFFGNYNRNKSTYKVYLFN